MNLLKLTLVLVGIASVFYVVFCAGPKEPKETVVPAVNASDIKPNTKVKLSDAEWKEKLGALAYKVTRQKGTERSGTGKYNKHSENGVYQCVCCGQSLFKSSHKFDSGTGWPSFYEKATTEVVGEKPDASRTEVICTRCDAHLGHVFNDGPEPTGLRYCINSVSLTFKKEK